MRRASRPRRQPQRDHADADPGDREKGLADDRALRAPGRASSPAPTRRRTASPRSRRAGGAQAGRQVAAADRRRLAHPNSSASRATVSSSFGRKPSTGLSSSRVTQPAPFVARGQHDPRGCGSRASTIRDVGPVAVREQHVEQHQVGFEVAGGVEGLLGRAGLGDDVVPAALRAAGGPSGGSRDGRRRGAPCGPRLMVAPGIGAAARDLLRNQWFQGGELVRVPSPWKDHRQPRRPP